MLAQTMMADLRARAARVCWCKFAGCLRCRFLVQSFVPNLPVSDSVKMLPKGCERVTNSLSSFALGARKLNKYGLDPLLRFPLSGPVISSGAGSHYYYYYYYYCYYYYYYYCYY